MRPPLGARASICLRQITKSSLSTFGRQEDRQSPATGRRPGKRRCERHARVHDVLAQGLAQPRLPRPHLDVTSFSTSRHRPIHHLPPGRRSPCRCRCPCHLEDRTEAYRPGRRRRSPLCGSAHANRTLRRPGTWSVLAARRPRSQDGSERATALRWRTTLSPAGVGHHAQPCTRDDRDTSGVPAEWRQPMQSWKSFTAKQANRLLGRTSWGFILDGGLFRPLHSRRDSPLGCHELHGQEPGQCMILLDPSRRTSGDTVEDEPRPGTAAATSPISTCPAPSNSSPLADALQMSLPPGRPN